MAIRITLECGHSSSLRVRTTPEGYTHDWEVFVRGVDGADISQYIEKVIFNLHETFPKPKRMFKEPPYIVKESGYAGFVIPITIYLKNKNEPKVIEIQYDLTLQHGGPTLTDSIKHSQTFFNPADDFRKKLLKGGGIQVQNTEENHDKSESMKSVPMVGKPKLSGSEGKKSHRPIEPRSEFADLFGVIPIKSTKVSPENKKPTIDKSNHHKISPDKSEKTDKNDKSSKSKHSPHKDSKKNRTNDEKKDKKEKDSHKDRDRSKEKSKRPQSPVTKHNYHSPSTKRPSSPAVPLPPSSLTSLPSSSLSSSSSSSSSSTSSTTVTTATSGIPPTITIQPPPSTSQKKQQLSPHDSAIIRKSVSPKIREKEHKKSSSDRDREKDKDKDKIKENSKISSDELKNDKKKKKHKDDKDSDRREKNRDKERDKLKESKSNDKKTSEKSDRHEKLDKEKSLETKISSKDDKKSPKQLKDSEQKQNTKIRTDKIEMTIDKTKDIKIEKERHKNKHRKKDKKEKRDESKDREKREKKDKQKSSHTKDTTHTSLGSSQQSISQTSSSTTLTTQQINDVQDNNDTSDSPNSGDDEQHHNDHKILANNNSNNNNNNNNKNNDKDITKLPKIESRLSRPLSPSASQTKKDKNDKSKKDKIKLSKNEERENKKRKRRCDSKGDEEIPIKRHKDTSFSPPLEPVSSSQSPITTYNNVKEIDNVESTIKQNFKTEPEQIAPDSTNNMLIGSENDEPLVFSDDYVSQLKELQQKIMTLQDNDELQRVVQVIAATGQYEITRKTFDFDLCALKRETVQRLQQFFSAS